MLRPSGPLLCARPAALVAVWEERCPRVRKKGALPLQLQGLSGPKVTPVPGAAVLALLLSGSHTLRIRGAEAWKMAEGLGANFFLTSGT